MQDTDSRDRSYLVAAFLGAVGGGLVVALATRAIPRLAAQMMSATMQNMMAQMAESGCDPGQV